MTPRQAEIAQRISALIGTPDVLAALASTDDPGFAADVVDLAVCLRMSELEGLLLEFHLAQ